jgi:hypothetical protein
MTKSVITYLAQSSRRDCLAKSLQLLHRNFNGRAGYPVHVFVEADDCGPWIDSLAAAYPTVVVRTVTLYDQKVTPRDTSGASQGYRRMCHFMFCDIQRQLDDFDSYWRLDTDSYLLDTLPYDPFQVLADRGAHYGYIAEDKDDICTSVGAVEFFLKLADEQGIPRYRLAPLFDDDHYTRRLIYNNFEIVDLEWWNDHQTQLIASHVIHSANIFRRRWGDHLCRTFQLLLTGARLHRFEGIDYCHYPFVRIGNQVRGVPQEWVQKPL